MKYEKPKLVDLSKIKSVLGVCVDGDSNVENCSPGGNVVPGCTGGGIPTVDCGVGDSFI